MSRCKYEPPLPVPTPGMTAPRPYSHFPDWLQQEEVIRARAQARAAALAECGHYELHVRCTNCAFQHQIIRKLGECIGSAKCPRCECAGAEAVR